MSIVKRPRRFALIALAGIVLTAAVLAGWIAYGAHTQVVRAGPSNDYPFANATDCSKTFGIYSWCLKNDDMDRALGFGYRNCTDYAAYELNEQMGGDLSHIKFSWSDINVKTTADPQGDGNARAWKQGAINHYGAGSVNNTPKVGAVAWWGPSTSGSSFGHVGIVASVSPDQQTIIVYSFNAQGDGNFYQDTISTTRRGLYPWPEAFLHIADAPTSSGGSDYGSPSDYAGKIVQWKDDHKTQKTAWLVSPDLKRYWIPDGGTFNCLTGSGFAFVNRGLPSTLLDRLPDQTNQWARCGGDTLGTSQYLFRGSSLVSSNGQYHLALQRSDGNLVLYGPSGPARWSTGVSSDYLVMQPDGNLVTVSYKDGVTWSSNTVNKGANHLVVTSDGNLALQTADGRTVWSMLVDIKHVDVTVTPVPSSPPTVTPVPPVVTVAPPTVTPTPSPTVTPPPQPTTWTEQEGDYGANSFTNPHNASGMGPHLAPMTYVQVSCKVYDPTIASVNPDGYWYRIASAPWSNQYYVAANTFWNGDIPGHPPYTHNTDWNVPNC